MNVGIIGIGAWATSLAILLNANENSVIVWSSESELIEEIKRTNENRKYFPGVSIPKEIFFTNNKFDLQDCDLLVQAVPTQFVAKVLNKEHFDLNTKQIVNVAKGIEKTTLRRISEILLDFGVDENNYSILTGPSHAEEVVKKVPTAVVVASKNSNLSRLVQKVFSNSFFRVYSSEDVIGCEIGGALKNVIAIAAGIIDGLELGDNSKAALITRGLAEITRLGVAMGANPLTFSGLSGLGDLIVTCNSKYSRNRFVGEQLARGKKLREIIEGMNSIAEGVDTTISAYNLSRKYNVELPITNKVYEIMFEDLDPREALISLMLRETKPEWWR
ncbi:MAG: NAD(P)-dependent glycerol-3-phosphate dehydrogenase [Ignavibacteria bacterium]|nr:NAD(P)-dependent glycerol-3-phosphate dehydrogenase [Ignavibacteria bacterium]